MVRVAKRMPQDSKLAILIQPESGQGDDWLCSISVPIDYPEEQEKLWRESQSLGA